MQTYYRYTVPGHQEPEAARTMLGPAASHGLIVRVDTTANQTHIFVAADAPPSRMHAAPAGIGAPVVVSEAEVLRTS
jgi:hypothetical protein